MKLHYMFGMLQVQGLKITPNDTVTDHFGGPALLGHLIGIQGFRDAGATIGSMGAFKAGMQALVSVSAVAMAIARHLMHYARSLGCGPIGFHLSGRSESAFTQLLFRQNSRKNLTLSGRLIAEGWDIALAQLGLSHGRGKNDNASTDHAFHNGRYCTSERLNLGNV